MPRDWSSQRDVASNGEDREEWSPEGQDHRRLREGRWWARIPAWRDVDEATFGDHRWQLKKSVRSADALEALVGDLVGPRFMADVRRGLSLAPMRMQVSPYILGLIDWSGAPERDPIRRQFIPLGSEHEPDHPRCTLDALAERRDAVAPGLTHRYPDKVLFLALDVCPVYCRYCTRSYAIGGDTDKVSKAGHSPSLARWEEAFAYLDQNEQVEDVVISGGDLFMLKAPRLKLIGERLLAMPNIRRIRIATKGLAVMPQKVLSDRPWSDAVCNLADQGRARGVQVCIHTHFAHPAEITALSREACALFFQRGVTVRNQCVLLRGVNDDADTMTRLVKRLAWISVEPYYVYIHDMVPGVETLRTTLADAVELEKQLRGRTAGFMTPTFVCDAVGGGGKRDLHSYEHYDDERGVAVYRSPVVDPERAFYYFDPLRAVSPALRQAWRRPELAESMVAQADRRAGLG